jgi:hypothetical protein
MISFLFNNEKNLIDLFLSCQPITSNNNTPSPPTTREVKVGTQLQK